MEHRSLPWLALAQFLHRHFLWVLVGAYAIAAVAPAPGLWIRDVELGHLSVFKTQIRVSLLLVLLASLMFNAGLGVKTAHLHALVRKLWVLAAGLAANALVPILYIYLITTLVLQFWHNPEEAQHILVGLALVAAMPIAGASTAWAQNSNGNLALSLGLVLSSTLLSPLVTPIVFYVFGEMASEEYERVLHGLADYSSAAFLGLWVVLPSLLGLGVRLMVPEPRLAAVMPYVKLSNSIILLALNYSNASVSLPKAVAEHDVDFLAITLSITTSLCVAAFSAAYWLSCLFKTDEAERVSLMYGLGMNNNGTGLVLASLALASFPRIMVPIIFYNIVQHLVAGAVQHMMGREAHAVQPVLRST
ncbi:MAG TPA: bile acid:sodium symporter [Nitrospira sp.]|nr:bile acid:sodium symporter [Nitrospira sp.]